MSTSRHIRAPNRATSIKVMNYTAWVKKIPLHCSFLTFYHKRLGIFNQFFYTP